MDGEIISADRLGPDGSDRRFERLLWHGRPAVEIRPAPGDEGLREAFSFYRIGSHLAAAGISVPEIFHYDRETGILVVEDLGDDSLHGYARHCLGSGRIKDLVECYRRVLDMLVTMQFKAAEGFDPEWCWQGGRYDRVLCLKREAGYFLDSFVKGYLKMDADSTLKERFMAEAALICTQAAGGEMFLHRDFQSRNIMLKGGRIPCIIDFQAARLGPAGYDPASLIHDPYADLPWDVRQELLDYYLGRFYKEAASGSAAGEGVKAPAEFERSFWYLSLMRLLQAAGAYGYLAGVKGRGFFTDYMGPAVKGISAVLCRPELAGLRAIPMLVGMVEERINRSGLE